ncbi:glycosyltransferase family 2 protein [Prevotella sp. HCN-7019]|uniref:glycosyltransferase family 2 protein n=1 Tax=Prevotella sp. HCN-7019 TaxID=3134668 RepID=UPI0030BF5FFB
MIHNEGIPLVSILIPLYNANKWVSETLDSLKKQTYKNVEIIVVDDHSTDNSLAIAKEYESDRIHVFINPRKGGNAARNYAFEVCNGDYIKFMDADDYCTDDMIEKQMERILKDGDNDTLVFSPVKMLYPDGRLFFPQRKIDKDYTPGIELLLDIWRGKGWNCPHCHLMHRDLFIKSGGWDENIIKNQDGEFFARVAAKASMALSVNNVFAIWRQTGTGVSSKMSLEAQKSVLRTYDIISHLIISYKDNDDTRYNCARYIGFFVYTNYPQIKELMQMVYEILNYLHQPLILPQRRVLKFLRTILGWKIALCLIHKFKL